VALPESLDLPAIDVCGIDGVDEIILVLLTLGKSSRERPPPHAAIESRTQYRDEAVVAREVRVS